VHIPWPAADYWSVLPLAIRRAIHDGLLANDVVGFHTRRWRRNFIRAAEDIVGAVPDWARDSVGYEGRRIAITASPISVDPTEFDELAHSPAVLGAGRKLARHRPEKLVLRVDRTDPSKNIVRGFRAFELYLDAHPEMHTRVVLVALLDPSRQEIPEYAEYVGAIQREARRVNDRFQQDGWMPIDLQISDNFPRAVAAYKDFDVLFVNAIFDGLNLVAKEAPLVNERDGVLILSENAGAHEELGDWVLSVNPFDVAGQADAIHRAIEMPAEERRDRSEAIRAWVREHDLEAWIDLQLRALDAESLESPV
jgi:trehalose 6-phosphate synthase